MTSADTNHQTDPLLQSLKADLPALEELLEESESHWGFEDPFYRFYHQSFKVFHLQDLTLRIVEALRKHDQGKGLNAWFLEIVAAGTGKSFTVEMNRDWTNQTRSDPRGVLPRGNVFARCALCENPRPCSTNAAKWLGRSALLLQCPMSSRWTPVLRLLLGKMKNRQDL